MAVAPWAFEVERFAEARAPELQSLFSAIQSNNESKEIASIVQIPDRRKRRTRSHNRYKHLFWTQKKKNKKVTGNKNAVEISKVQGADDETETSKGKKRELKIASLSRRVRRRIEFQQVAQGRGGCSKDGTRRLATHVWHAKRFYMVKKWGFWIPKGIHGRGRGANAVLRWVKQGAVLHDLSYHSAIQLEGSKTGILQVLNLVLEPLITKESVKPPSNLSFYIDTMVHHCGRVPLSPIAPATVIIVSARDSENATVSIWIHSAAFDESFKSLQVACEGICNVNCVSRKGELARLEVFGKKAPEILQKIMTPRSPEVGAVSLQTLMSEESKLWKNVVVPLEVYDPREANLVNGDIVTERKVGESGDAHKSLEHDNPELVLPNGDATGEHEYSSGILTSVNSRFWINMLNQLSSLDNEAAALWDCSGSVEPPLSEKVINKRRERQRLSHFRLKEEVKNTSCLKSCPILLLKHTAFSGCSIILPLSWVHAFWMPLVLAGARVVGQNERRWLMTHAGVPSFPFDFPDCASYKEHVLSEVEEKTRIEETKPPGKRLTTGTPGPLYVEATVTDSLDGLTQIFGHVVRSRIMLCSYLWSHKIKVTVKLPDGSTMILPEEIEEDTALGLLAGGKSCFVRVMIQPQGKGVIEEGSVLCAPHSDDFHNWLHRSQDWRKGVEASPDARRNTIGYVTSAAPWRSQDAAVGFCDVREISKLQSWQLQERKTDGSFFVMFQNPRSTKLRPALASVAELQR